MTRGQLATAVARSAHLEYANGGDVQIRDYEFVSPEGEEIYKAVARGFIGLDDAKNFRGHEEVSSDHAVHALRKLALLDRDELDTSLKRDLEALEGLGTKPVSRQTVAVLLARILGL